MIIITTFPSRFFTINRSNILEKFPRILRKSWKDFKRTRFFHSFFQIDYCIVRSMHKSYEFFTKRAIPRANFPEIVNETRLLSASFPQLLSRHHQSRPTRADASRIKLDGVQARLYVVRAGDARVRKSAGCAVSPVRVSRHSITSPRPFLASLTSLAPLSQDFRLGRA